MKITCVFLVALIFIGGCKLNSKNQSQQNITTANVQQDKKKDSVAMSLVERLPEFKNLGLRFKKKLDRSHHLAVLVSQRPDSSFKFYNVQAGDDDSIRFEPWYNFYVNLKDSSVSFYDTVSDSVLTMQQWRKTDKDVLLHQ